MAFDFAHRNPDPAPASAGAGPLRGLRLALQPAFAVSGWPAEAGSAALAGFHALEDAVLVERLRRGGAWLCGATRMSEFGLGLAASQAGEAVCADAADSELALDLLGESREAARRAGLWSFKPSYGLIPRLGVTGLIPSMEGYGLLARRPGDLRGLLLAMAGPDDRDASLPDEPPLDSAPPLPDPRRTVIGIPAGAPLGWLTDNSRDVLQAAAGAARAAGFAIRELTIPEPTLFALVHRIAGSVEASSCAGRYDSVRFGRRAPGAGNWNEMFIRTRGEAFGPLVKALLFQGAYFQFERYAAYEDACRIRARLLAEMQRLDGQADFLMLPAGGDAPAADATPLDRLYTQFSRTLFANVTGRPALAVPPAEPGGAAVQLTAPRRADLHLLALAEQVFAQGKEGKRHGP